MLHIRMSAPEGWVSIDDALGYLWEKVYGSQPPAVDWAKRLPRPVYIKAYWPPSGAQREEFTAIHMDNLHILFDDPTHVQSDDVINIALKTWFQTHAVSKTQHTWSLLVMQRRLPVKSDGCVMSGRGYSSQMNTI